MATNQIAVPGSKPGEIFIPALGKSFQQVELREDDVYDSVAQVAGAIAAGTELEVFRDIQNKNEQHTNIPQSRRIQAGDEVAVFRVGIHPREAHGNTVPSLVDLKKVFGNSQLLLQFNRRLITSGPTIKYPSGYGVSGSSNGVAAAGLETFSVGVPSVAAAPTLFVPQQLRDNDDIICKIRYPDAQWLAVAQGGTYTGPTLAGAICLTVFLRGVIKAPLGK